MMFSLLRIYFVLFITIVVYTSCNTQNKEKKNFKPIDNNTLIKTNRIVAVSEEGSIEDYIRRYQWQMQKSGSGLRYMIYKTTNGKKTSQGDMVVLNYNLSLINGQPCYSSANDGQMKFVIGKSTTVRGLEEGVLLMKKGEKGKFILPSRLGFGLQGDLKKIPKKAILVYDVELVNVMQINK